MAVIPSYHYTSLIADSVIPGIKMKSNIHVPPILAAVLASLYSLTALDAAASCVAPRYGASVYRAQDDGMALISK